MPKSGVNRLAQARRASRPSPGPHRGQETVEVYPPEEMTRTGYVTRAEKGRAIITDTYRDGQQREWEYLPKVPPSRKKGAQL